MVIYSWTHTHRAATKLYHILTHPGTLLKEIQGQSAHSQEQKKQLKSIQQQTEEQDQMEDDPDMLDSTATEMVPVSMLNARTVASMEESLPVDDGMQDGVDDSSDDSITPGQPRRKIDRYRNPFSPTVSSTGEQEDDEGWLGAGEECSEYGETKSNSVRMSSPKTSRSDRRRIPDFSTPSLGPAMDPSQFKDMADNNIPTGSRLSSLSASSVFNTPRLSRSSSPLLRTSNSATSSHETIPAATLTAGVQQHGPSPPSLPHQGLSKVSTNDSLQRDSEPEQLPAPAMADSLWTEQSHIREEYYAPSMSDVSGMVTSTTASFTDISSVAFSESSGHSIPSFTSIPSFDEVIS
ncbi:hypothetical protein BGX28_009460 [Mortierella sp. GBA30]|nr:hypothetical protein BGX28_009460 [Mortierella sp. GBA30]